MNAMGAAALATSLAVACVAVLSAQTGTTERREKTKIEVTGGKKVSIRGCLERSAGTTDYMLADELDAMKYAVVTNRDLTKYVQRRVEIRGNLADRSDSTVKLEHKVEGTSGQAAELKVEREGDTTPFPYLGLKSIKAIAPTCR